MSLNDAANKIFLQGHKGAHTKVFKQYVLDYLQGATRGLSGNSYKNAIDYLGQQLLKNPRMSFKGGL